MLGLRFGLGLGLAISYQVNFGTWAATAILVKDAFWQQPARTCIRKISNIEFCFNVMFIRFNLASRFQNFSYFYCTTNLSEHWPDPILAERARTVVRALA